MKKYVQNPHKASNNDLVDQMHDSQKSVKGKIQSWYQPQSKREQEMNNERKRQMSLPDKTASG